MKYVTLGQTGLKISRLCLGCMSFGHKERWMVNGEDAKRVLNRAWDIGINFFDTANVYSEGRSEEILGEFLQERGREEAVIATKVCNAVGKEVNQRGLSRKHVLWQIGESLKRLKSDYVDLYQIHRWDYDTPIAETLSVMTDLVHQGRVRYIGASSMWSWQFAKALYTSEIEGYERFVSMQNLYNLLFREEEREMIPLCKSEKIALIPWSPTAAGFLSGKYFEKGKISVAENGTSRIFPGSLAHRRYAGKPACDEIVKRASELAKNKGATTTQIAISWLLHKDMTAPIIGTTSISHLEEFVESMNIEISREEAKYLEEPYKPQEITEHE